MRIIVSHNKYKFYGGEDSVVEEEIELLKSKGHQVLFFLKSNLEIDKQSIIKSALQAIWSNETTRRVDRLIRDFEPDIIHSHNTFPLISPSLYWIADKHNIPIVQTLHNFRLLCLKAMFLRENMICEKCLDKSIWYGVLKKCYRTSFPQSFILAMTLMIHRFIGTYKSKVTTFIALNHFCREKFLQAGIKAEKIKVKPNFVDVRSTFNHSKRFGGLFVGRLSAEKGIQTLRNSLEMLGGLNITIVGTGPEEHFFDGCRQVVLRGQLNRSDVYGEMTKAKYLIVPSLWYENFPRTIVEAFAHGLPVIASRIGALAEIVDDGKTGLLFEAGSEKALAERIRWAEEHPEEMEMIGRKARFVYEKSYGSEGNYESLMSIYKKAIYEKHK